MEIEAAKLIADAITSSLDNMTCCIFSLGILFLFFKDMS